MNSAAAVEWSAALAFLALGLGLGAALVWRVVTSRAKGTAPGVPLDLRDLAGKRDALVLQLRELEDTASKRTPLQLARERYALELETARVLLTLDKRGIPAGAKRAPTPASGVPATTAGAGPADRAGLRGFLWGTLTASALLLLGIFVYQSAKPRPAGGSLSGGPPMDERRNDRPGAGATDEAEIRAALARDPNDVDAHLSLARLHLDRGEMMEVWNEAKWVLERAPGNPQALVYQALVRLAIGQGDAALGLLTKALAIDPNLVDGYAYTALVYVQMGRVADAEAVIATASQRFPDKAAQLRGLLEDQLEQQAATGSTRDGDAAAASADRTSVRHVSGTIELDPSHTGKVAPGAVLFVFVREAGPGAGPPVAAARLPPSFPARFDLGEADAMMGQPFPDTLLVEARLDSDGDPTTRPPSDPRARLDDVKAGRNDVRLVLR
jgi:tetratricopeptide (TPR) repeat protein